MEVVMNNKYNNSYGWDKLSKILIIFGAILFLFKWTILLGTAAVMFGVYRAYSKDTYRRALEERAFETWVTSMRNTLRNKGVLNKIDNLKKYKVVKCPKCGQKLRLPRGKGKIVVTCRKCLNEFKMKS